MSSARAPVVATAGERNAVSSSLRIANLHSRRQLLWLEITRRPTAVWLVRQITVARFPGHRRPAYLVRDNDRAYGPVFTARVRPIGDRQAAAPGPLLPLVLAEMPKVRGFKNVE